MSLSRAAVACCLFWTVALCAGPDCSCDVPNGRCDDFGVCRCDPGWDGHLCERCVPMPGCAHGACSLPWQCSCEPGWGGRFCDKDLSACSQQPCRNGATCRMEDNGDVACLCPEGFHGANCEQRTGPCHQRRSPCKNGGLCEDADGSASEPTCRCLAGFTGPRCETDVDDCLMTPCANGATCLDAVNRFSCVCPAGFTGRFCTVNLDDCASRPCQNGGRCLDRAGGFRCVCRLGFSGTACETTPDRPGWPTLGWEGGGGNASRRDDRLLKVTVKERGGGGVTTPQLVLILVLGGATLGVVLLTASLVLRGRCRGDVPSRRSSSPSSDVSEATGERSRKKKLNVEAI